jgi:NFU1 iron-sulfur cluster scaffold homolog, mitochondrial
MSPAADAPIRIKNGEVTIDAAFLAPRLGLAVEALQAEMRRGAVVSTVEEGRDEDAGRTRVTVRYGRRIWRVVVEPDGTFVEMPPRGRGEPEAEVADGR